jgi:hypothetical protein
LRPRCEQLEDRTLLNVQFTIDPLQDVKPISRYIYGVNQVLSGYTNYTFQRLGGDLTSAWNWVNGDSNAGHDYYYQNESLSYFTGGTGAPGGAAIPLLQSDYTHNAATLLTVPINGYVAANTANDNVLYNPVTTVTGSVNSTATVIPVANAAAIPSVPYYIVIDSEEMEVTAVNLTQKTLTVVRGISGGTATPQANDPVYLSPDVRNAGANYLQTQFRTELPLKPGAPGSFTLTPDPNSQYVYADEFVNWVNTLYPYGQTSSLAPIWFQLDNEPELWNSTHTEFQPSAVTYAEVLSDGIAYAEAIKSVEPNALVFGPTPYGWEGYLSLQNAPDAAGRDWLAYYLQQMQQASVTAGERLLDVLDVHYYSSAPGDQADIVQSPRSLWDPTYMENSWIAQSIPGPIELLPRLQADINQFYAGTKMSISEYNFGGGGDISGAIAEADALGIFGVQGLYAASEWQLASNESYIAAAFNMYRNFNGSGGTFGDTSVLASTNDVTNSSIYASVDSSNANSMTLVAINKSTQAETATMQLEHVQPGATAAIYQLTSASTTPQYMGTVTISNPNAFTYTMPGYSVTTIRIVSPSGQGNAPTVVNGAQASSIFVTGVSTNLSVLGADANGEQNLTYTWIASTAPAPVTFSANGTNTAKDTVAWFSGAGSYTLLVTITNAAGYFATSSVTVTVAATLTDILVTPAGSTTTVNGLQQFTASSTDQFGNVLNNSPSYSWSASAGSIASTGVFTAPASAGSVTITASASGVQGSTNVAVVSPTTVITVSAATDAGLRGAVTTANTDSASGVAVTIRFAGSLAGDTIKLTSGVLELKAGTGTITLEGGGLITLSGGGASGVFLVDSGAHANLDGLVIENGNSGTGSGGGINNAGTLIISNATITASSAGASGGGIENTGSLTVTNINVTGNSSGSNGGGINNESAGTLTVTNGSFSGNSAPTGGGINNAGTATIQGGTFNGNNATGSSGTGAGIDSTGKLTLINALVTNNSAGNAAGGIYNGGQMTVSGSTIDDNTGSYVAGGINNVGSMTVVNSTIAGNYAYLGGGIYNGNYYGGSANLTLSNDTITSNFAAYGAGGGIYMATGTYSTTGASTLSMFNTLVAGNFASGNSGDPLSNPNLPFGPDIQVHSGNVSGSYNLVGDGQGLTGISNGDANHNQVGTPAAPINALLAAAIGNVDFAQTITSPIAAFNMSEIPLKNNGGPTQTIALLAGSPAIGAGGALTTVTTPIVAGSSSVYVADAAAIASTAGQYFIFIDGEEMEVTSVNLATNVLTVVRAINGFTATLHSGDAVYLYGDQRGFMRPSPVDIGAFQSNATASSAATNVEASNQAVVFSGASQSVPLIATVTPSSGTVNAGTVTFSVYNGSTQIGSSVTSGTVTGDAASVTYTLPAGTAIGAYSIHVSYSGTSNFGSSNNSDDTTFPSLTVQGTAAIISNGQPGYSETGTGWTSFSDPNAYNGNERYAAPGTGANTATWQVSYLAPGTYNVEASWTAYVNRATNASYKVYDGAVLLGTIGVDQTQAPSGGATLGGVAFQNFGRFTVSSGTLKVVLSDNANGYVIANAVDVQAATLPAVVDNRQYGYSETGTGWTSFSDANAYLGNERYAAPGTGANTATWQTPGLVAGIYDVEVNWTAYANRATNATYQVFDGTTLLATILVNQQLAPAGGVTSSGVLFQSLGRFTISSGTLKVVLSDNANGYVIADALYVQAATLPAVVDNSQAGYSETGSGWASFSDSKAYLGNERYAAPGTGANTAIWQASGLAGGTYDVEIDWTAYSNRATNATYEVFDGATLLATLQVNQQLAPTGGATVGGAAFQSLGRFPVGSGTLKVVLSDNANGFVVADAILVQVPTIPALVDNSQYGYSESGTGWTSFSDSNAYLGNERYAAPGAGTNTATWQTSGLASGPYNVYVDWTPFAGRATNATYQIFDGSTLLASSAVDQTHAPSGDVVLNGIPFQSLGRFPITSGTVKVTVSDNANGYVIADAMYVKVATGPVVVDNGQYGYAEAGTGWISFNDPNAFNGNERYVAPGMGSNTATWSVPDLAAGTYNVQVDWTAYVNRATNANYQVFDGATLLGTVIMNQQMVPTGGSIVNGVAFQSLGHFTIGSGTLRVVLSDNANGYVIADAMVVG